MVSKRCSDVVESRVEHAIRCRKPQECSFYFGFGTAPARYPLGDAPTSDNDSPRRAGLSIDELDDLSIDHLNCSGGSCRPQDRGGKDASPRRPTLTSPRATLRPDSPD